MTRDQITEQIVTARLTKGQLGHLGKQQLPALRYLREFRLVDDKAVDVEEGATTDDVEIPSTTHPAGVPAGLVGATVR